LDIATSLSLTKLLGHSTVAVFLSIDMLMQRDLEIGAGEAIDPAVIRNHAFAAQKWFDFS
jgi:hypothetical protein